MKKLTSGWFQNYHKFNVNSLLVNLYVLKNKDVEKRITFLVLEFLEIGAFGPKDFRKNTILVPEFSRMCAFGSYISN